MGHLHLHVHAHAQYMHDYTLSTQANNIFHMQNQLLTYSASAQAEVQYVVSLLIHANAESGKHCV